MIKPTLSIYSLKKWWRWSFHHHRERPSVIDYLPDQFIFTNLNIRTLVQAKDYSCWRLQWPGALLSHKDQRLIRTVPKILWGHPFPGLDLVWIASALNKTPNTYIPTIMSSSPTGTSLPRVIIIVPSKAPISGGFTDKEVFVYITQSMLIEPV